MIQTFFHDILGRPGDTFSVLAFKSFLCRTKRFSTFLMFLGAFCLGLDLQRTRAL